MPGKVIDVPFSIDQNDPNWTAGSSTTAGSGDGSTEALFGTFLCPVGMEVVILPMSSLAAYLADNEAAPAELGGGTSLRIVHTDSAGAIVVDRIKTVYDAIKDFADQAKLKRFEDKFKLVEKETIKFWVTPVTGKSLNPATGRFQINGRRISKLLSI